MCKIYPTVTTFWQGGSGWGSSTYLPSVYGEGLNSCRPEKYHWLEWPGYNIKAVGEATGSRGSFASSWGSAVRNGGAEAAFPHRAPIFLRCMLNAATVYLAWSGATQKMTFHQHDKRAVPAANY